MSSIFKRDLQVIRIFRLFFVQYLYHFNSRASYPRHLINIKKISSILINLWYTMDKS